MMKLPVGFKMLAESSRYILGHIYEDGFIIKKGYFKDMTYLGSSYGDPEYGLIGENEDWALLLGHESYLWMPGRTVNLNAISQQYAGVFQWPFDARQVDEYGVEVLDDPWSENAGVYYLDVKTNVIKRVRDFEMLNTPYDEDKSKIHW